MPSRSGILEFVLLIMANYDGLMQPLMCARVSDETVDVRYTGRNPLAEPLHTLKKVPKVLNKRQWTYELHEGEGPATEEGSWISEETKGGASTTYGACAPTKVFVGDERTGTRPSDGSNAVAKLLAAAGLEEATDRELLDLVKEVYDECVEKADEKEDSAALQEAGIREIIEFLALFAKGRPALLENAEFQELLADFVLSYGKGFAECPHSESVGAHVYARDATLQDRFCGNSLLAFAANDPVHMLMMLKKLQHWTARSTVPAFQFSSRPGESEHLPGYQHVGTYGSAVFLLDAEKASKGGALGHVDDGWTVNMLSKEGAHVAAKLGLGKNTLFSEQSVAAGIGGSRALAWPPSAQLPVLDARLEAFVAAVRELREAPAPAEDDGFGCEAGDFGSLREALAAAQESPLGTTHSYEEVWCAAVPAEALVAVLAQDGAIAEELRRLVPSGVEVLTSEERLQCQ